MKKQDNWPCIDVPFLTDMFYDIFYRYNLLITTLKTALKS